MNFWSLLCSIAVACAVAPGLAAATRSGGPYELQTEHLGSGGGRTTGSVYTLDSSLGGIGGIAEAPETLSRNGYVGQLYEVATLEIVASPATVEERGILQVQSSAWLDDGTRLEGLTGVTAWTALSGPIHGITAGGLVTAGTVHEDTPATLQGTWLGISGTLNLSVMNVTEEGSSVTLSAAVYTVFQGASSVDVTLARATGEGPATVLLATSNGSNSSVPPFTGAVAGKDYQALSTVIEFADQELVKTQSIPLLPRTGKAPNTRFQVTLSEPGLGTQLGTIAQAEIQVLADDSGKPSLTLKTPAAGMVSLALPVTVYGTVGDAFGIERLEYRLNDSAPVTVMLGAASKATSIPFAAEIEPVEGPNRLELIVYDLRGNSATLVRDFVFERRYLLTLQREVPVEMQAAPDKAGMLALAAAPAKSATALTKGPASQTTQVVGGAQITVTATAKANHLFSHWTGLPDGAQVHGHVVFFTMPTENVPNLSAVFVANPLPALLGSRKPLFQGLLQPAEATVASNATVGLLTGTLTPAKGSLSGKIWLDGKITSFVARLHGDGSVWFPSGKTLASQFSFLGRSLQMSWSNDGLDLRVSGPAGDSEGLAKPPAYSKAQPVDAGLLDASGKSGYYTVALPAKPQVPEISATAYPQGAGYQTLTLLADGSLSFAGQLADGSKITASGYLVEGDESEFFVQLPTPGSSTKNGSFSGILEFDSSLADSDVSALDLQWFRPEAKGASMYAAGWPQGLRLDAVGARYDKSIDLQAALELQAADAGGNARLIFSAGQLETPPDEWEVTNFNITQNKVMKVPASDKSFTLAITSAKGLFNGTFTPNWSQPGKSLPKFLGVILQKGANRGGYGYFISNRVNDPSPQSGNVSLQAAADVR